MSIEITDKQETKQKFPFLSEGILIAVLTGIGYAIAYYYESGYKGYFKIPEEYIELNPTMIVRTVGLTIVLSFFLFIVLDLISIYVNQLRSLNNTVASTIDEIITNGISFFFFLMLFGLNKNSLVLFLIFISTISIISFGMPILTFRKIKGYRNKLEASYKRLEENNTNSLKGLMFSIRQRIGYRNFRLAVYLIFVAVAIPNFSLLGEYKAKIQIEFMIVEGIPNYIMLGSYKDYSVVAELDTTNKVVIPKYKLIKNENFEAKLYNIGPLKVEEPENL
ncbi:hypothetical protein ABEW19_07485 [Paenibacillus illinoisensis]|uniref:hypothetical protein n=1 Tax=Paenibacillus illinoisensis TaxID=59845 RepID=UPI003D27C312